MMIDVCHAEETQARLEKVNALVHLIYDYTEELVTLKTPFRNEFETICTNLATVHDLIFDLNADLDKTITDAYRKTPRV